MTLRSLLTARSLNGPLNDALAAVTPDSAEGQGLWLRYVLEWSRWNHVRTAASLGAAALLTLALLCQRR